MGLYNYLISSFRSQFTTPFLILRFYRVRGCGQVGVVYVLAEVRRGRRDCRGVKRRTAVKRNKQRRTQIIRTGQLQGNIIHACVHARMHFTLKNVLKLFSMESKYETSLTGLTGWVGVSLSGGSKRSCHNEENHDLQRKKISLYTLVYPSIL